MIMGLPLPFINALTCTYTIAAILSKTVNWQSLTYNRSSGRHPHFNPLTCTSTSFQLSPAT